MAVLPILRTENVGRSTFPSAPEGRGYRRGWWVRVGGWVGWRCWLCWRSLSSLEEMPARTASRLGSPVGARKALIGSWAAARPREALAPAERDCERDVDRDPERDVDLGAVLDVVSVPRPPALRLGASPTVRLGVSPAVGPVVLRWGAGCAGAAGVKGPERAGAGGVPVPWLACRREDASSQALAPEAPTPAAPRPDEPDRPD